MEVSYIDRSRPSADNVREALKELQLESLEVKDAGEKNQILRFQQTDEKTHQSVLAVLERLDTRASIEDEKISSQETFAVVGSINNSVSESPKIEIKTDSTSPVTVQVETAERSTSKDTTNNQPIQVTPEVVKKTFEEIRFEAIGPTIGKELRQKTYWALVLIITAIVVYIAWAFRKVSKPVTSWKYGTVTIVALLHDIIIPVGIFSLLGRLYNIEVNAPFVAALLTILGYSVNDTIVVFDRIRENLLKHYDGDFDEIVESSIRQTLVRSFNTSITTLLSLIAIFFFGGESIRDFVLALIIGVVSGTYSSIFIASPLLVTWRRLELSRS